MKTNVAYFLLPFLFLVQKIDGQTRTQKAGSKIDPAMQAVQPWFNAWEMVSRNIYNIDTIRPVEFVFFDAENVYSTSAVTVPTGVRIKGPLLFGKTASWKKSPHTGTLLLPNGQTVPVGLMSFAAPLNKENKKAFFVMPLPGFWKSAGVSSKELGLDKLITGVFLHEFAHSQQTQNFGARMDVFEQDSLFANLNFSDDIIQDIFEKDSIYNAAFRKETALFYLAAADTGKKRSAAIDSAMKMLEDRQQQYYTGGKTILKQIDDFFLTMEGVGQYTMYAWLVHPRGGNIPAANALPGVRRKKSWSQDEGFALILLLSRLVEPKQWAPLMFGNKTVSAVELINSALQ